MRRSFGGISRIGVAGVVLFGLLGIAEYGCRQLPAERNRQSVFIPVPEAPAFQQFNPAYTARYLAPRFQPVVAYTPFREEKPAEGFRVVVLGGATALGYPYHFYLSFASRLQARLEAWAIGQPIEVINLGLRATSSMALWDLKDDVVALEPDAILIYNGHSEYYGSYGVRNWIRGTGEAVWKKRLWLGLKRWALVRSVLRWTGWEEADMIPETTQIEAHIPRHHAVYEDAIAQYTTNMEAVLHTFAEAHIPVYWGTAVSNLKGQVPLSESDSAMASYWAGRNAWEAGDTLGAYQAFMEAKEIDALRFRAPEAINDQIRQWAAVHDQVHLVDLMEAITRSSPSGIADEVLFFDHVHPSYAGHEVIAQAFFEALKHHPVLQKAPVTVVSHPDVAPDAFERGYADIRGFGLLSAYAPDLFEREGIGAMIQQGMLGMYARSQHYADSLLYQVFIRNTTVPQALRTASARAWQEADTTRGLLFDRSLQYWHPFDEALWAATTAKATHMEDTMQVALQEELWLHAFNQTRDTHYLEKLAARWAAQGREADAEWLLTYVAASD